MVLNTILFFALTAMGLFLATEGIIGMLGYTKCVMQGLGQPDYSRKRVLLLTVVGLFSCCVAVLITAPMGIADGTMLAFAISAAVALGRTLWFMAKGEVSWETVTSYAKVNLVIYIMLWLFSLWIFVVKPYTWFAVGKTQNVYAQ